jgi:hypothetical protein
MSSLDVEGRYSMSLLSGRGRVMQQTHAQQHAIVAWHAQQHATPQEMRSAAVSERQLRREDMTGRR